MDWEGSIFMTFQRLAFGQEGINIHDFSRTGLWTDHNIHDYKDWTADRR